MAAPSTDKAAIRQVIRALRNADHVLIGTNDGEVEIELAPDAAENHIIEDLTACDESWLYVQLPDGTKSHVYFVLGNEPFEVVCDHGMSLSPVLDPLTEKWDS